MVELEVPDKKGTTKIHFDVIGDGIPLVLIHGWLCSKAFWDDFLGLTEIGYKLILPDLRGHGTSPPAKDVDIETLAEDINRILEYLKIPRAIIIGHSMGGLTAQAFYRKHEEKVIALGLWNTGPKLPLGYGIGALGYVLRIASFFLGLLLSYPIRPLFRFVLVKGWALAFKGAWKSEAYKKLTPIVGAMTPYTVIKAAFALAGYDGRKSLHNITVPTMLLHGKADRHISIIQMAEKLKAEIPNSRLYLVENAAHFPPNEVPQEVLGYLKEFLNSLK